MFSICNLRFAIEEADRMLFVFQLQIANRQSQIPLWFKSPKISFSAPNSRSIAEAAY
jgi:hypothetical protein